MGTASLRYMQYALMLSLLLAVAPKIRDANEPRWKYNDLRSLDATVRSQAEEYLLKRSQRHARSRDNRSHKPVAKDA